jgi:heme/copper-type cytochrome/quinol oxidase subunit 2
MLILTKSLLDYAIPSQLGFQDPASPLMLGLINLHHYIMFFLIIILFFVFTMLYFILTSFTINNKNSIQNFLRIKNLYSVDLSHNTAIEVI